MDAVEILLFSVVGFSVLVFLILDNLDGQEKKKTCHQKCVGGDGVSVNFQQVAKEEETENPDSVRCQESSLCSISGNNGDDICGIIEGDGEGEEGFIDDWEGIERTELEKIFGKAVVFVSSKRNFDKIGDVNLVQLDGLERVVLQGPCHGPQPMALKVSAQSKWNAWQKLGNMSREMAMETYVDILTNGISDWKGEDTRTIQDAATAEDITSTPQNKFAVKAER